MDRPQPPPLPAAVRWLLIVLLPAVGFLGGALGSFELVRFSSSTAAGLFALATGAAGAAALLALGLVLVPWLPAVDQGAPGDLDDGVPPASHPDGVTWIGPGAALLFGLGIGVVLGAGLEDPYSYRETFNRPGGAVLVAGALAVLLLLVHAPRGVAAVPTASAPFHRVVARALLCAALGGVFVGAAGAAAIALVGSRRDPNVAEALVAGLVAGALLAALVSLAETGVWRVPPAWRWPWLVGSSLFVVPSIALAAVFLRHLTDGRDPLEAGYEALSVVAGVAVERPGRSLSATLSLALPATLVAAARAGVLPYFGQRAPWPAAAQVPLAWFAAAVGVALLALSGRGLRGHDLRLLVPCLALIAPALVVALRLAAPLEERLARRWVLLTGGGR